MVHLGEERVAAYLAGTLDDRDSAEAHFEQCVECHEILSRQTLALPFQPVTLDGKPRLSGMTETTLRCGWGRLIGPYMDGGMEDEVRRRLAGHLLGCESCAGQLAVYTLLSDRKRRSSLPSLQRLRQPLQKWGLFWRCFWRRGKGRGSVKRLSP